MDRETILAMSEGFQEACILGAAAELQLFDAVPEDGIAADDLATRLGADRRGITTLADALAAIGVLEKDDGLYRVPPDMAPYVRDTSEQSVLPMIRHRMSTLRGWIQLAWTVSAGMPPPRTMSIRGCEADRRDFIRAMDVVTQQVADDVVARLAPFSFSHLLDVGGASGTWTFAFLRAFPAARATIFDLPHAIDLARERVERQGIVDRVDLVAGDYYRDPLPGGADFVWLSAITHQHSRQHNRALYRAAYEALSAGGQIGIRDVVMEPDRTRPLRGAMFAVNMLSNTPTGGTFTFEEYREDLESAGFREPHLRIHTDDMNSVILAHRP